MERRGGLAWVLHAQFVKRVPSHKRKAWCLGREPVSGTLLSYSEEGRIWPGIWKDGVGAGASCAKEGLQAGGRISFCGLGASFEGKPSHPRCGPVQG